MSGILDPGDQRLVSRFLNDVNDPAPGNIVSTSGISGSIIQSYYGMVGKRLVCTYAIANKLSDTSVGQLYEGIYQYVQFRTGMTTAPARGGACYWDDYENYIVTCDVGGNSGSGGGILLPTSDNAGLFAGVALTAVTKGNYGFIQIAGKASMLFKSSITKTTPLAGDAIVLDADTSNRADVLANATTLTWATAKLQLGVAIATPVSNAISTVDLWNLRQVMGGLGGF